jgi:hypothetical protein
MLFPPFLSSPVCTQYCSNPFILVIMMNIANLPMHLPQQNLVQILYYTI